MFVFFEEGSLWEGEGICLLGILLVRILLEYCVYFEVL